MKKFVFLFFLNLIFSNLHAFEAIDFFRHSEIAGKNSIFADVGMSPFMLKDFELKVLPINFTVDYLLPLPLPFSAGAFLTSPFPNLKHFGIRAGFHFDVFDPFIDLYFIYSYDFGYLRNDLLAEYGDEKVEPHYYDFRIGVRYFFSHWLGLAVETGYKFESVVFSLSIKIN